MLEDKSNMNITFKYDKYGRKRDLGIHFEQYYFYLSFENSLCDQYITEKFFKILFSNSTLVPVVMGAPKQERYKSSEFYENNLLFETLCEIKI
jgi:hypothetical protein